MPLVSALLLSSDPRSTLVLSFSFISWMGANPCIFRAGILVPLKGGSPPEPP